MVIPNSTIFRMSMSMSMRISIIISIISTIITSCSLKQEKQHEGSENQKGQECADADALEVGTRGLWSSIEWNAIVSNYEGKNDRSFT